MRLWVPVLVAHLFCFNPRICKRCDEVDILQCYQQKCFNPRICKRCDYADDVSDPNENVSIHASVKDATVTPFPPIPKLRSFNPRICKRCDSCWSLNTAASRCFNPRICKRCDFVPPATGVAGAFVSIHASVKDATRRAYPKPIKIRSFNPRICKRCDALSLSQSKIGGSFNPRICKRCDGETRELRFIYQVSIHASVKDATQANIRLTDAQSFNPRICKRCDQC